MSREHERKYDLKQRKTEKAYGGSVNRWIDATYKKNKNILKEKGVSYVEFRRDIQGILKQETERFEKGYRISQPKVSEALKKFERSETFRSADERAYENLMKSLRKDDFIWERFKNAYRKTMGGKRSIPTFDEMKWISDIKKVNGKERDQGYYTFQRGEKQIRVEIKIETNNYKQSQTFMYFYNEKGEVVDKIEVGNIL